MPDSKKVLLDTNFLLIPGQFNVDIFNELDRFLGSQIELEILENSLNELQNILKTASGADKEAVRLALSLIEKKGVKIRETFKTGHVDDMIVDVANDYQAVCTQDMVLTERIHKKNVKVIFMKQKKYLDYRG